MTSQKNQPLNILPLFVNYLRSHFNALKLSFRNLCLTPFASFITMAAIGMCLSFPVALLWFIKNVQNLSHTWDKGSALSIYVDNASTKAQIDAILVQVNAYPFVEKTTYVSPEKALQEFKQTSDLKDMLDLLPENPLPGVISIEIDNKASKQQIQKMQTSLANLPRVIKTVFDYEWVNKLNAFLSLIKTLALSLYCIIGFGVVLMVANTIRLSLERHKDEIEVLNLIGATTAFIRRPFLYRGILYGSLGGALGVIVVNLMIYLLSSQAKTLGSLFDELFFLENLKFYDTVLLLAASACLGWLGAAIAFTQQNHALTHKNS
ncbi:MAG: ABC transporter permease [Proteobacteria bacterium]|nr:ABC transporter permease [Pseudomonadota bacterium]